MLTSLAVFYESKILIKEKSTTEMERKKRSTWYMFPWAFPPVTSRRGCIKCFLVLKSTMISLLYWKGKLLSSPFQSFSIYPQITHHYQRALLQHIVPISPFTNLNDVVVKE